MDVWEGSTSAVQGEINNIGGRPLSAVAITIEPGGSVTLARNTLESMLTDTESALQLRPKPSLTTLDGCSYISGINA